MKRYLEFAMLSVLYVGTAARCVGTVPSNSGRPDAARYADAGSAEPTAEVNPSQTPDPEGFSTEQIQWLTRFGQTASDAEREVLCREKPGWCAPDYLRKCALAMKPKDGETARALLPAARGLVSATERVDDARLVADATFWASRVANAAGELGEARSLNMKALVHYEISSSKEGLANCLHALAVLNSRMDRPDESLGQLERVRSLYEELGDANGLANYRLGLAGTLSKLGRIEESVTALEGAVAALRSLPSRSRDAAFAQILLATSYADLGDTEKALALCDPALKELDQSDDKDRLAEAYLSVARIHGQAGHWGNALPYFDRAVRLAEEAGDRSMLASCLMEAAKSYAGFDQIPSALQLMQRAWKALDGTGNHHGIGEWHFTMARVHMTQDRADEAMASTLKALEVFEAVGDKRRVADCHLRLSGQQMNLDRLDEALASAEKARAIFDAAQMPLQVADCDLHIATALFMAERFEEALNRTDMAEPILLKAGQPGDVASLWSIRGHVLQKLGRNPQAINAFHRVMDALAPWRAGTPDPAMSIPRAGYFVFMAARIAMMEIASGRPEAAFDALQRGKGQAERGAILGGRAATRDLTPGEVQHMIRRRKAYEQAEHILSVRPSDQAALKARDGALADLQEYMTSLQARYPRLAKLTAPPSTLAQVCQALGTRAAVLEMVLNDSGTILLLARNRQGKPHLTGRVLSEDWDQVRREVEKFRAGLLSDASAPTVTRLGQRLYDLLIRPVEEDLDGIDTLVICPDGILSALPFAALQDAGGKYLIERFAITHAPSASVWETCRSLTKGPGAISAPPLVAAISDFSGRSKLVASLPKGSLRDGRMSDLPHALKEASMVKRMLGPDTILLEGDQATVEAVTKAAASASILHIATHAFSNDVVPLQSAMVLAPSAERPLGLLYARDIYDLRLSAELTVLSACSTSEGAAPGKGLMGLSWAFLVAGCPRIIASIWNVDDRTTRLWMTAFYGSYAGEKKGAAESVRAAALSLIRTKGTAQDDSSPHHWAAWTLIGNDR